jgi:hypothetical protein
MKAVVIGIGNGASMETIMAVYPRHKVVVSAGTAIRGQTVKSARRG